MISSFGLPGPGFFVLGTVPGSQPGVPGLSFWLCYTRSETGPVNLEVAAPVANGLVPGRRADACAIPPRGWLGFSLFCAAQGAPSAARRRF